MFTPFTHPQYVMIVRMASIAETNMEKPFFLQESFYKNSKTSKTGMQNLSWARAYMLVLFCTRFLFFTRIHSCKEYELNMSLTGNCHFLQFCI